MNTLKQSIGKYLFVAAILGLVIPSFINGTEQGDFKTFYAGASAYRQNLNPYDTANLSRIMGGTSPIAAYVYPPITLLLFEPLTLIPYQAANILYVTIKLLALFFLIFLWFKIFPFQKYETVFFIVCLFAFGGTIITDLRSGNISIFEQLLIWVGMFFYLKKKFLYFTAAIVLVSQFKFLPIILLGLLLLSFNRKEASYAFVGIIVFLLIIASNYLFFPLLSSSFLRNATGLFTTTSWGEKGKFNPATLSFIQDFFAILRTHFTFSDTIPIVIFIVITSLAIGVSVLAFRKLSHLEKERSALWQICLMCFLYAVIVPRFKSYSYILLIAPALYTILHISKQKLFIPLALFFLVFLTYRNYGVLGDQFFFLRNEYYSLMVSWLLFMICCYTILKVTEKSNSSLSRLPFDPPFNSVKE